MPNRVGAEERYCEDIRCARDKCTFLFRVARVAVVIGLVSPEILSQIK